MCSPEEGLRLVKAFRQIIDPDRRLEIITMIEEAARAGASERAEERHLESESDF
jgi:hypothetical protein